MGMIDAEIVHLIDAHVIFHIERAKVNNKEVQIVKCENLEYEIVGESFHDLNIKATTVKGERLYLIYKGSYLIWE